METTEYSSGMPFFEVDHDPIDERYGRIRVCSDQQEPMGVLDYFHGISEDIRGRANQPAERNGRRPAFYITRLSCSNTSTSSTLERALLYIAACIADKAGEEVMYCRPRRAGAAAKNHHNLWEIHGVRQQLDNYGALVQQV